MACDATISATQFSYPSQPASTVAPLPRPSNIFSLPSPSLGRSCPVRTPPTGEQELIERPSVAVQLPPLSKSASQLSSPSLALGRPSTTSSSSIVVDSQEAA